MPEPRQETELDPPLYIRWTPDVCPYALEMRLGLITRLKSELDQADALGTEVGGAFVGVFPTPAAPTLRLDDIVFVPRSTIEGRSKGSREFHLGPVQLQRLVNLSAAQRRNPNPAVGFFRSHLRSTPLVPSPADRAMLAQQFPGGLFAFLMIGESTGQAAPRQAVCHLAVTGELLEDPSSLAFPFDESAFQSLSEVPAEATEDASQSDIGSTPQKSPTPWPAVISLAVLLFLIGTWTLGSRVSQFFRPPSNQIDLMVIAAGTSLKITWDHSTPVFSSALGATVIIEDGPDHRELKLDSDELRVGQISYQRLTRKVSVLMRLDAPGKKFVPQTFDWNAD